MSSAVDLNAIISLLKSKQKLERDRGLKHLKHHLNSESSSTSLGDVLQQFVLAIKDTENIEEWEILQGCLAGAKCVLDNSKNGFAQDEIVTLQNRAKELLTHEEVRVRLAAGELLGSLCKTFGVQTYIDCSPVVLGLVKENLERQLDSGLEPESIDPEESTTERKRVNSVDAATIFHESAGWRFLETSMKCLQFMIEGCGKRYNPFVTQELLDLIFTALSHENRFVRETGYYVCASLVNIGELDEEIQENDLSQERNSILKYGDQFSAYLAKGLSDNWSQVRLASSTAARFFLLAFKDDATKRRFFPALLPRICLNRYYVAEGVRIYTQQTWKKLTNGKGRDLVQDYIDDVAEYYIASTKADNHAVREAACACIAELGGKIDPSSLKPHVPLLLKTLLDCFHDDSWPVRDAACVACGNFIVNFADEAKDVKDELYRLFLVNLRDPISSVRQGASGAVANYVKAYGNEALEMVIKEIEEGLKDIENQPENTEKYTGLDKAPAQFGVVKKLRDNDIDLHSNQTMYSCGSLAPKMGRGKSSENKNGSSSGGGGCSDCRFQRPSEPWERSDGCVYLLTQLLSSVDNGKMANQELATKLAKLLPLVVAAAGHRHFTQHIVFVETICKQLPLLARSMGKRIFKPHLESFFDTIFYALQCDTQLTSSAADECLNQLAKFLGPSILRGRIESYNAQYLSAYDTTTRKQYTSDPGLGPSPGSLTPFPKMGFVPTFPTDPVTINPQE